MYPSHNYANEEAFCVRPAVVHADSLTTIRIYSCSTSVLFSDTDVYELHILPKEHNDIYGKDSFSQLGTENICPMQEIVPKDGVISFAYRFYGSQEWIIYLRKKDDSSVEWYWVDSFPKTRARLSLYSLTDDLYGLIPMKGDLHIHTNRSDGKETPEYTVASYREAGFDFLAITDHHVYNDATELLEYFSFANPMRILPGEEVHEKTDAVIHMVSIGASAGVSSILQNAPDRLNECIVKAKEKYNVPPGVFDEEYLLRAVIYDEIKKNGGMAIFPHPLWQLPERYNTNISMSRAILENRLTDAFEVFGGCTPEGNDLQQSFYYSLRGERVPVVGSSDSHTVCDGITAFNEIYTLCFVRHDDIIKSIYDEKSVAVYNVKGEMPRICGAFELSKYSHFLLRCYFPKHNRLCEKSGSLLKKHVEGDIGLCEKICEAESEIRMFIGDFFGYDLLY